MSRVSEVRRSFWIKHLNSTKFLQMRKRMISSSCDDDIFIVIFFDMKTQKKVKPLKKACVVKKGALVASPRCPQPPSLGLWISTVDSCVSIVGSPGGQTHALVHGGRSAVGGRGRCPGKAFDMHKTSRPAAESQHRQQDPPPLIPPSPRPLPPTQL